MAKDKLSIDTLLEYVNQPEPDTLIEHLHGDDEFVAVVHDLTSQVLKADFPDLNVDRLRERVDKIDDSSQIAMTAFKVGFLFGVEYWRRESGRRALEVGAR